MSKIIGQFQVQPSSNNPPHDQEELRLPLLHFDIPLLLSNPTQSLNLYEFPCSKLHFVETLIPELKQSLSLALKTYLPLCGNILIPLAENPNNIETAADKPFIYYISGDYVPLTFSEFAGDITYFADHHRRAAVEFYDFAPDLPKPEACRALGFFKVPVLSLQVTLFPEKGVCVGVTNHHAVCDANGIWRFLKSWASFNRCRDLMPGIEGPFFGRERVEDPEGRDRLAWEVVKDSVLQTTLADWKSPRELVPSNQVRSTFILTKDDVDRLKNFVLSNRPELSYITSFTVISAYIWTCHVRSSKSSSKSSSNNSTARFGFGVDCRPRLNPPLPPSYFGNCLVFVDTHSNRSNLITAEDWRLGFLTAVELIEEAIRRVIREGGDDILEASDWPMRFERLRAKGFWVLSVAGSPRFDMYEVDFGWGRAKKNECVHIDWDGSLSLSKARDFEGGFEIGVSMEEMEMDCFEEAFVGILGMMID